LRNLRDARLRAVLEAAARRFGWGGARPAAGRGFGLAGGTEKGSYVAACAEVAVDRPGGRVRGGRVGAALGWGAVLNPEHLKNQVEGATVMGLGGALFEAIDFAAGPQGFALGRGRRDAPRGAGARGGQRHLPGDRAAAAVVADGAAGVAGHVMP